MADPLLEPITINGMQVKNRIFTTAHAPLNYTQNDLPTERYLAYQEEKIRGGLGLLMFGGSSFVAMDSHSHFGAFNAGTEDIVPFYKRLAGTAHDYGAKAIVQITHLGRRGDDKAHEWLPVVGPSHSRERAHRAFPKPADEHDISRIIEAYASAARRAQQGGLDGVEIAMMSGHLIDQFFAERSNLRDDEWGGPLGNRARFALQVIDAVRDAVGPDFVVGVRSPGDDGVPGGVTPDEAVRLSQMISATDKIDFFNVIFSSGWSHRELGDQITSAGSELGGHLHVAGRIRAAVKEPVMQAARIADLATARHALREGFIDLVGMTRAHIADPHIVKKIEAGEEERIRPCVGASHCLSGNEMLCIHNPATGREEFIPHLIRETVERKRVVIIGGGPAGLEAARVSAERGHDVTLFEADTQVGGQVLPMSRLSRLSEKRSIVEWLHSEARIAGADIQVNSYVESDEVRATKPDVVIVATGGLPNTEVALGGEHLVMSPTDVLAQNPPSHKRILICDDHGAEQAVTAAEYLSADPTNSVEIVTVDAAVGQDIGHTVIPGIKKILYERGVGITPDEALQKVERADGQLIATFQNTMTDETTTKQADIVVVEHGTLPLSEIYDDLKAESVNDGVIDLDAFAVGAAQPAEMDAGLRLYRIGDAVSHRGVHAAIYDARRLCMNL